MNLGRLLLGGIVFLAVFIGMFAVGWPVLSGVLAALGDMTGHSRSGSWWLSLAPLAAFVTSTVVTGWLFA